VRRRHCQKTSGEAKSVPKIQFAVCEEEFYVTPGSFILRKRG
jgi:hypothetical protein